MKKALLLCAMAAFVVPAMADLDPSAYTPQYRDMGPASGHTIAIYNGFIHRGGASGYPASQTTPLVPSPGLWSGTWGPLCTSDTVHLTFAFHWVFGPVGSPVFAKQFQFSWLWDNSEVETLAMYGAPGIFNGANNFSALPSTWWAGPSAGTFKVGDVLGTGVPLWCNPLASTGPGRTITWSGIYPFMQVDLHIKGQVPYDALWDVLCPSAALLFTTVGGTTLWWTGGVLGTWTYGANFVPEPASLSLLGISALAIGGGIWRRRR